MSKAYSTVFIKSMDSLIENCAVEVISTVSGISVNRDINTDSGDDMDSGYLSVLQLHGDFNGMLLVMVPEQSIRVLTSFMTGMEDEQIQEDDMHDCISELANMICGLAKAKSAIHKVRFSLSTPFSIRYNGCIDFGFKKGVPICSINLFGYEISIIVSLIFV